MPGVVMAAVLAYTVTMAANGNGIRDIMAGIRLVLEEIRDMKGEMREMKSEAAHDRRAIFAMLERMERDAAEDRRQAAEDRREAAEDRKQTRLSITRVGHAIVQSLKRIERKLSSRGNGAHG